MRQFKSLLFIVNLKTIIVTTLAVVSTWLCQRYDIVANFPLTIIATAVIFPLVFSIGGAYKRREAALREYGSMKAHGKAIYFAVRDWMAEPSEERLAKSRQLLGNLLTSCRTLFEGPIGNMRQSEEEVYDRFSEISKFIKSDMRDQGLASGEVSRCNQFLSKMTIAFENIKHIYQYRTPQTLRTFSDLFVSVLPPLYGPYFAYLATDYTNGLQFVMPILFTMILVSLANIQEHLENPFDQIGQDDVTINAELFVERLR